MLVLTLYDEYLPNAFEAGAVGYLRKDVHREELIQAIRAVVEGRSPVHVMLERERLAAISGARQGLQLSEREQSVLRLVASGVTTKEMASQLILSETTVKRTLQRIFEKMGVRSRSEAVAEAIKKNLI